MRILILSLFYWPDSFGIAPYSTARAEFLASRGHDVSVCTAMPFYPEWRIRADYRGRVFCREEHNGVNILRAPLYVPRKVTTTRRMVHEASFVATALMSALKSGKPDLLIAVSPPLGVGLLASLLSKLWRIPFVFHVEDLQPDAALELKMFSDRRGAAAALYALERFTYRNASIVSTISDSIRARVVSKGIDSEKVALFPQWVDPDLFAIPEAGAGQAFRRKHGLDGQFLAIYSGNMGVKQGLDVVLRAAQQTAAECNIRYLLIGDGAARPDLEARALKLGLTNVTFLPPQSNQDYLEALAAADVSLVTQQRTAADFAFPSKVLHLLAAGRPIVASVSPGSDVARVVKESKGGVLVEPENAALLANAIRKARDDRVLRSQMSRGGKEYARSHWDRLKALTLMEGKLLELIDHTRQESEVAKVNV